MEKKQLEENLVQAIQSQSQQRLNHLQEDYESRRQEIIQGFRQEAQEESNVFIEQALADLKNSLIQNESQSKWKIKKDLFIKRAELVDQLFQDIRQDLIVFTQGTEYKTFIKTELTKAIAENPMGNTVILVKATDVALVKSLVSDKIEVTAVEHIHIGGFILKEGLGRLEIDETLDYALRAQREWFSSHSNLDF
jgi:vacuolar-type H+-ATPase subunit E/Vma4